MENVICTVLQEKTSQDFISFLNKYGTCVDFSNDYERSKATQGIFAGVINKVYDVVWKGEGGHSEHDTLFMSAKSIISSSRECQPFRVGFVGKIVSQLVEVNLKEGDAIGILKPKFFYALDIPSLGVGVQNAVVWVAKDLKDSCEFIEDAAKSSDDHESELLNKRRNGMGKNKKRTPFLQEDSDSHSVGGSSTSGTLQHDIQIFRTRPVELKRSPAVSVNNKLAPDSTTRTLGQRCQNNLSNEKKSNPGNVFGENIVSQNTANVGSVSCRNENQSNFLTNLDSAVKSAHRDVCGSCHNVNNTCGVHPHTCMSKCCCFRVHCCNYHPTPDNHFKDNCCSCNRTSCGCYCNQRCSCTRNSLCGHNVPPQCIHWNSAHSCHTNNSACKRHLDHHCRSMRSCCGPCHINQCCHSNCQNGCLNLKQCHGQANIEKTNTVCSCKQSPPPIHCHVSCRCDHEKINTCENVRVSACCASRHQLNPKNSNVDNSHEEMSVGLSEDSHKKSRTKEWVSNWVDDPPHLLPEVETSDHIETNSNNVGTNKNPSSESRLDSMDTDQTPTDERQNDLISSNPVISSKPFDNDFKKKTQKHISKKKKLYSPLDNSTIISEKTMYCNSTIVEESTPFDSENHTDTPQVSGITSDKNQEAKDKNVNVSIASNISLNNRLDVAPTNAPVNNNANNGGERSGTEIDEQESVITNQFQNKGTIFKENRISSEEEFPELRIETPIISQACVESEKDGNSNEISNKIDQCKSATDQHHNKSVVLEKSSSSIEKMDEDNNKACDPDKSKDHGDNNLSSNGNIEPNVTIINKGNFDSSSNKSLSLQDYSKSKASVNHKGTTSEMDLTLISDKNLDKEGMKRSKESSDDAMELTCESLLIKRRKKEKFRKTRSVGSLSSGRNINDCCTSSTDSFYDARSDGILSIRSNKWCLKPMKEVFDKPNFPLSQKEIDGLSFKSGSSYDLNLFSSFNVIGIIINILPDLSKENYGSIVKGFCNEGCKREYRYEDYKAMEPLSPVCTFCRYNYHLTCPGCLKSGLKRPLCFYYDFEIHLFDGANVLRIEIFHKNAVHFLGCTPQMYLSSETLYKKISKIIFPISQEKWVNPVLLKARIKVMPRSGASLLTLDGTSLRKDLTLKGSHYKL